MGGRVGVVHGMGGRVVGCGAPVVGSSRGVGRVRAAVKTRGSGRWNGAFELRVSEGVWGGEGL